MASFVLLLFAASAQEPGDAVNHPPDLASLAIGPDRPRVTDVLRCTAGDVSDPDGDPVEVAIGWTVGGESIGATGPELPAKGLARGDRVACVGTPSDGTDTGEPVVSATVAIANSPPAVASVSLSPASPLGGDSLTCTPEEAVDADGDEVSFRYAWKVGGEASEVTTATLPAAVRGVPVSCVATPYDGVDTGEPVASAEVVPANHPPVVGPPTLAPDAPTVLSPVTCTPGDVSDPDGDPVDVSFSWYVNGEAVDHAEQALAPPLFVKGDRVVCTVTAGDGKDTASADSHPVEIGDAPAAVLGVAVVPEAPTTGDDLTCKVTRAEDPDGDPVKLSFLWSINGADAAVQTSVLRASATRRGASVACTATPTSDGRRGERATSATVTIANTPPVLTDVALTPESPTVGDRLACAAGEVSDADGDPVRLERRWEVSGEEVAGSDGLSAPAFRKGDTVRCSVTPTDGTDRGAEVSSATVTVVNTPPSVSAPTLRPAAPTVVDRITARTDPATDPDGDEVTVDVAWTVDGEPAGTGDLLEPGAFRKGQQVVAVATPHDGTEAGAPARSEPLEVRNTPPEVASVTLGPDDVVTDGTLTAEAVAEDADGDSVDLRWAWAVAGRAVDHDGPTLSGEAFARGDRVQVTVTPHDGDTGGMAVASDPVTVRNTLPTAPWVQVDDPRGGVVDLVCRVVTPALDADEDRLEYSFAWSVDSEPYTDTRTTDLHGDTVPRSALRMDQDWTCVATASDDQGEGPPSEPSTVTVIAPHVGSGSSHACALDTAGDVTCWGNRDHDMDEPPEGKMRQLSVGGWHACAVRARDRQAACWGHSVYGQTRPPAGPFEMVSAGGWHTCGLDMEGRILCWGQSADGRTDPPDGEFVDLAAGWNHTCALDTQGAVSCWGDDSDGQASPPAGTFTQITAGEFHSCALDDAGEVVCWGSARQGALEPPAGPFTQVAAGSRFGCGLRADGSVACWGTDAFGQGTPPSDAFRLLGQGVNSMCGWTASDRLLCWGQDNHGQARPPR